MQGMRAYTNGQKDELKDIIAEMSKDIYSAALALGDKTFAMCSSGGFANKPANQLDIDMCKIMENQLKAKMALLQNEPKKAITLLNEALELDLTLSYSYGPPVIIKPIYEDYAETLLEQNQLDKANTVFDQSLNRNPKRLQSLEGKKSVLLLLKNETDLKTINDELAVVLSKREYIDIL